MLVPHQESSMYVIIIELNFSYDSHLHNIIMFLDSFGHIFLQAMQYYFHPEG